MGVYIKVDGDKILRIAGTVANQSMIDEGYIEYNGEIPTGSALKYINETIVVDDIVDVSQTIPQKIANAQMLFDGADILFKLYFGSAFASGIIELQKSPTPETLELLATAIQMYPTPGLTDKQVQVVNIYKQNIINVLRGE